MSGYRFGCGKKFETYVPRGWDYKEITVVCGTTSPSGDPWQCERCEEKFARVDYRRDAIESGEVYGEEDY